MLQGSLLKKQRATLTNCQFLLKRIRESFKADSLTICEVFGVFFFFSFFLFSLRHSYRRAGRGVKVDQLYVENSMNKGIGI